MLAHQEHKIIKTVSWIIFDNRLKADPSSLFYYYRMTVNSSGTKGESIIKVELVLC